MTDNLSTNKTSRDLIMPSPNERLIVRFFKEVWNNGNVEILDELFAEDHISHAPGLPDIETGPEGLKPMIVGTRIAFPDLHYKLHQMVSNEDSVAIHTTMRGTHSGPFLGVAPTNVVVGVQQMQIYRIQDKKIVEDWRVTDDLTLMRQLGVI